MEKKFVEYRVKKVREDVFFYNFWFRLNLFKINDSDFFYFKVNIVFSNVIFLIV